MISKDYNTQRKKMKLPEYGRCLQKMVDHVLQIEDKDERNLAVKSIIDIMGTMYPYLRDINDFKHKLWDHVAIMSDFKLDIDYPFEIVRPENLYTYPEKIPYKNSRIRYMHYGRTIEEMIEKVSDYPEGEEKKELIRLIANQMKKCFLTWNKELVDNRKILDDLRELSKGKLDISDDYLKLVESRDVLNNKKNKGKKK